MVPAHMTLGLMAISQFAKGLNYPFNSRISILFLFFLVFLHSKQLNCTKKKLKKKNVWLSREGKTCTSDTSEGRE